MVGSETYNFNTNTHCMHACNYRIYNMEIRINILVLFCISNSLQNGALLNSLFMQSAYNYVNDANTIVLFADVCMHCALFDLVPDR